MRGDQKTKIALRFSTVPLRIDPEISHVRLSRMAFSPTRQNLRREPRLDWQADEPISLLQRRSPKRQRRGGRIIRFIFKTAVFGFVLFGLFYLGKGAGRWFFAPLEQISSSPLIIPTHVFTAATPSLPLLAVGEIAHRVKARETWATIMASYGFSPEESTSVAAAVKDLAIRTPLSDQLSVGQEISFGLTSALGLTEIVTLKGQDKKLVIRRAEQGAFVASLRALPKHQKERVLLGVITKEDNSFSAAAQRAGVSYDVVDDLVDLFSDKVRFRQDFQVGDRFTVIFSEEMVGVNSSGVGAILAARMDVGGNQSVAIRYVGNDGKARYFDAEGRSLGGTFLRYPLKFSRISSEFSTSRFHPVLKRSRPHNGVDFAAPTGTPVRSVANGSVVFAGRKGGNGLMVSIKHSDRFQTVYCHLSKIGSSIRRSGSVSRGQVIGAVGATGLATGPHLHFGFFDRGKYVDPLRIKLPTDDGIGKGSRISDGYLQRVLFTLDRYQSLELDTLHPTSES